MLSCLDTVRLLAHIFAILATLAVLAGAQFVASAAVGEKSPPGMWHDCLLSLACGVALAIVSHSFYRRAKRPAR